MRLLLRWVLTQLVGVVFSLFLLLRDDVRLGGSVVWDQGTLVSYADRIFVLGLALTTMPLFDFISRATDERDQASCRGGTIAWLVGFLVFFLVVFSASFGIAVFADKGALQPILVRWGIVDAYGAALIGAVVCSLGYIVRLEAELRRLRSGGL